MLSIFSVKNGHLTQVAILTETRAIITKIMLKMLIIAATNCNVVES